MRGVFSLETALILATVAIGIFILLLDLMMIGRSYVYLSELNERFSLNYELNSSVAFSSIVQEIRDMTQFFTGLSVCSSRVSSNCFTVTSSQSPDSLAHLGTVTVAIQQKTNLFGDKRFQKAIQIPRAALGNQTFRFRINFD